LPPDRAKRHFPGENPIGRRLVFGFKEGVPREIVGVVADVRRDGLGVVSRPEMCPSSRSRGGRRTS
jgi:hypothetical protein